MRRLASSILAGACLCCLALGYALALPWYAEAAPLGCALAWILAGRARPGACLAATVLAAALGALLGAPVSLIAPGLSAAVALWDFERAAIPVAPGEGGREAERRALAAYRGGRAPALALALGGGTLIAVVGSSASVGIPFPAMLACLGACALGLDRLAARLRGRD